MSSNLKFYWIDDLPDRKNAAENLANFFNWDHEFVNANGEDLADEIAKMVTNPEPELIIVDHKLQSVKDGSYQHGSTAAAIIREKWPSCPIVCISGVEVSDVTVDQRTLYEAVFSDSSISNHYETLSSIAHSFRDFRDHQPKIIDQLLELLATPEDDTEKLKAIIPSNIKENLIDSSVIRPLSNWVRNMLFERPGFLYDPLWAATFVGLSESGFRHLEEDTFKAARYAGLFHDNSKPRWWKSSLINILAERINVPGLPWEKGRHLPGITEKEVSKCEVTKEAYPETVGYIDGTHKERYPMKLKVTVHDDSIQDLLYFEEIRKYNSDL